MKNLFLLGGPLCMGMLTILLLAMIAWMTVSYVGCRDSGREEMIRKIGYGKSIGLFALMMGILFQLIGFYRAFSRLESVVDVSPSVLYGGLKISMITTIYGLMIYLLSMVLWFILTSVDRDLAPR